MPDDVKKIEAQIKANLAPRLADYESHSQGMIAAAQAARAGADITSAANDMALSSLRLEIAVAAQEIKHGINPLGSIGKKIREDILNPSKDAGAPLKAAGISGGQEVRQPTTPTPAIAEKQGTDLPGRK